MSNRVLSLKGTHQEIGEQAGNQYRQWGKKEVRIAPFADNYYSIQQKLYEQYFPHYISYLKGVAKGLDLPEGKVLKSYLTGFLEVAYAQPTHTCSVFALNNTNGVLIGRNYDYLESSEKISVLATLQFTDHSANSFTGISDMGTWERGKPVSSDKFILMFDDAWNDKGLYIALNGAPDKQNSSGILSTHIVQAVVEQCKTTDEAVKLIQKIPTNTSKIFLIADKYGKFTVVEKSLEKGTFVRNASDIIFTTNHFNHPELLLENLSIFQSVPFHSTFTRYHYLQYNLLKAKNNMDINQAITLLGRPPLRQNWRGIENGDTLTVWTYSLNLTTLKYKLIFAPILKEKEIVEN